MSKTTLDLIARAIEHLRRADTYSLGQNTPMVGFEIKKARECLIDLSTAVIGNPDVSVDECMEFLGRLAR